MTALGNGMRVLIKWSAMIVGGIALLFILIIGDRYMGMRLSVPVIDGAFSVGKINDIMAGDGISEYVKTANNMEGVDRTIEYMHSRKPGLIFTNLVDFDTHFGHRRDASGYAKALEEFDARIPELMSGLGENDVLIFTADHGNDPTFKGTDHTREYIPILVYGSNVEGGSYFGSRNSFADIGATIAELLEVGPPDFGQSFASEINKNSEVG